MADVQRLKKTRSAKLGVFNRKNSVLCSLLEGEASGEELEGPIKDLDVFASFV